MTENPFTATTTAHDPYDTDSGDLAGHHTLGTKVTQAARGSHRHDDIYVLKNTQVVNVKDYGAVGDWNGTSGTDNLAAFNNAVSAIVAKGGKGVINIGPGDYRLSDSWVISCDDIAVRCAQGTVIRTTAATTKGATVTFMGGGIQSPNNAVDTPQATRALWSGGKINASGSGTADNALGFVRYKNVHVADVVLNADRKAITAQYGVENFVWERFVIERGDFKGLSIETSCLDGILRDFDILASLGDGIHIMSVDASARRNKRIRLERGRIRNVGGWGILAGATDELIVRDVLVGTNVSGVASYTDCTDIISDIASATGTGKPNSSAIALNLQNSWVTQGAGYPTPSYFRDPFSRVSLDGNIKSGTATAGTVLATLPVGYRPANNRTFTVDSIDSTGAIIPARILVNSAGQVILQKGGNNFALSLDQVSFYAVV